MTQAHLKKLTLLHSNDMHGDFLAETVDEKLVGGVSMLSGYVSKVREEEENVLYCVAGDMFRGSVIDSEFQGISTIEIMNILAPDVVTVGNHEFDYGLAHMLFIEKCAKFPIVNANLYIRSNHMHLFNSHKILNIGGMKILVIGIVTEEVLGTAKKEAIGTLVDVDDAVETVGRICDAYNRVDIDLTVLLTHIGIESDRELAAKLNPAWGVDVIVGGHSHTLMDAPEQVNGIQIVQAGTGTDQIGRFDMVVDTDNNCIDSFTWQTVPINDATCPTDSVLEELIRGYKGTTDEKYGRVLTRFARKLTHPDRTRETELGNLFCDIERECFGVDIAMIGSGTIRIEEMGPIVQLKNLHEACPFEDPVYMIKLTGAQLKRMALHILRDEAWEGHTEFYQFSKGVRITYSKSRHELLGFELDGEDVADEKLYSTTIFKFHLLNIEDFLGLGTEEVEANAKPRLLAASSRAVLEEYLSDSRMLDARVEGRLIIRE